MDQKWCHPLLVLPLILLLFSNSIGQSEGMKTSGEIIEESEANSQLKKEDENFHGGKLINSDREESANLRKMFTRNSSLGKTVSLPHDLSERKNIHSDGEDDDGWKHWVEKVKNRNEEELRGAKKNKKELKSIRRKHEHQLLNYLLGNNGKENGNNQANESNRQQKGNGQSSNSKRFLLSWIGRKHHRKSQSEGGGERFVGSLHSSVANSPLNLSRFGQGEKAESSGTKTPTLKGKLTRPKRLGNANSGQLEKTHSMDSNYRKQKELGKSPHRSKSMDYLERLEELGRVGQQRPVLSLRQSEEIRKAFNSPIHISTPKTEGHTPMSSPTSPHNLPTNESEKEDEIIKKDSKLDSTGSGKYKAGINFDESGTHLRIKKEKLKTESDFDDLVQIKENMASEKDATFGKETIDENNNGSSGSSNDLEYEIVDGEMSRIAKSGGSKSKLESGESKQRENIGIEHKQLVEFDSENKNEGMNIKENERNENDKLMEGKVGHHEQNELIMESPNKVSSQNNKTDIGNVHPNVVLSSKKEGHLDHPESYLKESPSNKLAADEDGNHGSPSHLLHHKSHHGKEGMAQNNEEDKLNEKDPKENDGMTMEMVCENAKNSAVPFNEDGGSTILGPKKNNNDPSVDNSAGQSILNSQNLAYEWLEEVSKPKSIKTPIEPGLSKSADNSPHKSTHSGSSGSPKIREGDRAKSILFERYKKQRKNGHRRQGSLPEIFEPVGLQHVVNEEKRMESLMKINSVKWNQLNVKGKADEFEVEFGGKPRNEMEE